jgi:hypothetical protein
VASKPQPHDVCRMYCTCIVLKRKEKKKEEKIWIWKKRHFYIYNTWHVYSQFFFLSGEPSLFLLIKNILSLPQFTSRLHSYIVPIVMVWYSLNQAAQNPRCIRVRQWFLSLCQTEKSETLVCKNQLFICQFCPDSSRPLGKLPISSYITPHSVRLKAHICLSVW